MKSTSLNKAKNQLEPTLCGGKWIVLVRFSPRPSAEIKLNLAGARRPKQDTLNTLSLSTYLPFSGARLLLRERVFSIEIPGLSIVVSGAFVFARPGPKKK
jgi:hypothetical protein